MAILHISFKVKLIKNKLEQMKLSFLTYGTFNQYIFLSFFQNDFMLEMEETKSSNGWFERVTFWENQQYKGNSY
jgi:hypothetical protein